LTPRRIKVKDILVRCYHPFESSFIAPPSESPIPQLGYCPEADTGCYFLSSLSL
jgi:hypothetical protein